MRKAASIILGLILFGPGGVARADCGKESRGPDGWALVYVQSETFTDDVTTYTCTVLQAAPLLPAKATFITRGGRKADGAVVEVHSTRPDGRQERTCLLLADDYCLVQYHADGDRLTLAARHAIWVPGQPRAHSPESQAALKAWLAADLEARRLTQELDSLFVFEQGVNNTNPGAIFVGFPEEAVPFGEWRRQAPPAAKWE